MKSEVRSQKSEVRIRLPPVACVFACGLWLAACRTPLPAPGPVRLDRPVADSVVRGGAVTFRWDSLASAASYELQVDDKTTFINPVFDTTGVRDDSLTHFLPDGAYYWRVRGRSRDSIRGDWSVAEAFSVRTYRIVGQIRTRGYPQGICVRDRSAFIADGEAGLSIYDVADPAHPSFVAGIMDSFNTAWGVAVQGGYAYLSYGSVELQIVKIARFDSLRFVNNINYNAGTGYDVFARDTQWAFVANHTSYLICDVRDPNFPQVRSEAHVAVRGSAVQDSLACLACEQLGVIVARVSMAPAVTPVSTIRTLGNARGVAMNSGKCYVADGRAGLTIIDIADSAHPSVIGNCPIPGAYANKVCVSGNRAYVAAGTAGLAVVDVADPAQPVLVSVLKTPETKAVWVTADGRIFATDRDWGLLVVEKESTQ